MHLTTFTHQFSRWLAPPIFADEEQTRIADLLNRILWFAWIGATVSAPLFFVIGASPIRLLILNGTVSVSALALLWLMRRGQLRLAGFLFVSVLWLLAVGGHIVLGRLLLATAIVYVLVTVMVSLLMGVRAVLVCATLSIVVILVRLWTDPEQVPLITVPPLTVTNDITFFVANFVMLTLLIILGAHNTQQALARARANERVLIERNQALEYARNELEDARQVLARKIAEINQSETQLRRQKALADALNETTLGLVSHLEAQELFRNIVERAGRLLQTEHGYLALVDTAQEHLSVSVDIGFYKQLAGFAVKRGEGVGGRVWQTGQPFVVNDYDSLSQQAPPMQLDTPRAVAAVPIKSDARVVGVLGMLRMGAQQTFQEDEIDILNRFAQLASVALDNARLYEAAQNELRERKHAEEVLRQQNEQLSALHEVALTLLEHRDVSEVLNLIVNRAEMLVNASYGYVDLIEGDQLALRAISYGPFQKMLGMTTQRGEGLAGMIWQMRQPIVVNDYLQWENRRQLLIEIGMRATMGVPIMRGESCIGVLGLSHLHEGRHFDERQVEALERFAQLAAVALDNAQLYATAQQELVERSRIEGMLRRQNAYLDALNETALGLLQRLNLNELFGDMIERAGKLLDTPHGYISLVSFEKDCLESVFYTPIFDVGPDEPFRRGEGLSGKVWASGEPVVANDYDAWLGRWEHFESGRVLAAAGVPIKSDTTVIGVLGMAYTEPGQQFTSERIELLRRFAQLAAVALDNARLYTAAQTELARRKESEEAQAHANALLRAIFDSTADGILVVDQYGKITHFNQKFAEMWRIPQAILSSKDDEQALSFVLDQLTAPQMFLSRVRALYDNLAAESFDLLEFKDGRVFERYSQPQRVAGESMGRVWNFRDVTAREKLELALQNANVELEQRVQERTAQLSAANATLQQEIGERKRTEESLRLREEQLSRLADQRHRLLEISRTMLGTLVLEELVPKMIVALQDEVPLSTFALYWADEPTQVLRPISMIGAPPALSNWPIPFGQGVVGSILLVGQPELVNNAQNDPRSVYPEDVRFEREHLIGVPLHGQHRALGVYFVSRQTDPPFTSEEFELVTLFANQMAIALQNARLYEQIQRQAAELERRVQARTADLERANQDLARSNAELEQFAYVASHDLQEPLRTMSSYIELVARRYRGKLDSDADDFIAFAVNGAARMKQLIQDLLAYSRVGTRGKQFALTDSAAVLRNVLANLRGSIEADGARITFDPLPIVYADAGQLGQLFQNLLSNALKFHGERPSFIHVNAEPEGSMWRFSVRDNGIGIAPEYFERIFVIFQRLHTMAEYPGTGIGLALCKKIVERHDGRIWVESQSGQGTTFYFTLPAMRATDGA